MSNQTEAAKLDASYSNPQSKRVWSIESPNLPKTYRYAPAQNRKDIIVIDAKIIISNLESRHSHVVRLDVAQIAKVPVFDSVVFVTSMLLTVRIEVAECFRTVRMHLTELVHVKGVCAVWLQVADHAHNLDVF